MLLAGSISGRTHSRRWWCHDIGYPLLAGEHSPCKAPWSGTPCRATSVHSRTMSPLDSTWKPGFSLATSVLSALETSWQLRYINSYLQLPFQLKHDLIELLRCTWYLPLSYIQTVCYTISVCWKCHTCNHVKFLRKCVEDVNMCECEAVIIHSLMYTDFMLSSVAR